MSITPTAANCKMYVDIVKQQSRVLKLRDTGLALSRISTEEEGAELLANAASETVRDDGDVWSLAQGFSDWMHRYQKKPDYLDWFIPQLRRVKALLPFRRRCTGQLSATSGWGSSPTRPAGRN